jgi:hypothetical protein
MITHVLSYVVEEIDFLCFFQVSMDATHVNEARELQEWQNNSGLDYVDKSLQVLQVQALFHCELVLSFLKP